MNILLHASNRASAHHPAAVRFLADRVSDPDLFCLAWPTLMSYLRIATHPRIFSEPLAPAEALGNIDSLLRLPRVRPIGEGEGFLDRYRQTTRGPAVRGNLVPDAHLAALLRQHEVRRLYTTDAGFRRFEFLEVQDPFA